MALKTGPIPKIDDVKEEILTILVNTGGVGFGKLRELLGRVKDERRKTKSPATIEFVE